MAKRRVIGAVVAIMLIMSCLLVGCVGTIDKSDYIQINDYFDADVKYRISDMTFRNISYGQPHYTQFSKVDNDKLYSQIFKQTLNANIDVSRVGKITYIVTHTGARERIYGTYDGRYLFCEGAYVERTSSFVYLPYRYVSEPELIMDNKFRIEPEQFIGVNISEQEMIGVFSDHPELEIVSQDNGKYDVTERLLIRPSKYNDETKYTLIFKTENNKLYMKYYFEKYDLGN